MKYTQLTEGERYQIYGLLKAGFSQKQIAQNLERPRNCSYYLNLRNLNWFSGLIIF